jgi:hypothetical protein
LYDDGDLLDSCARNLVQEQLQSCTDGSGSIHDRLKRQLRLPSSGRSNDGFSYLHNGDGKFGVDLDSNKGGRHCAAIDKKLRDQCFAGR